MHFKPTATSWIEISRSALENNIQFIKKLLPEHCTFSAVIKGNAYGHDIEVYGPLAYACGLRHFSVYSIKEAYRLLHAVQENDHTTLCLGNLSEEEMCWAIDHNIEFYINNLRSLALAISTAMACKKQAIVHIEVETGMNRTGFEFSALKKVFQLVNSQQQFLHVKGVCTHLAGAESITNNERIQDQIERFESVKSLIAGMGITIPQYHLACSAVVLRYPEHLYDIARIGIMQYGFFPNNETFTHYLLKNPDQLNPLKRVMSWKTRVIDVKEVAAGNYVGYGTSYYTDVDTKVAIIPVGYAYGYARSLSNHGRILINGHIVEVIGTINMNMLTVDVSNLPDVAIGDEVVLIGKQGKQEISVSSFSEFSNQLNYELLARLPLDIDRIVVA